MRIIGGKHKGRIINVPAGLPVRPTTDMAKESLFNILNNHVDFDGLYVLDLFSGTGSISYEFASRGAQKVVAVDINPKCTTFIVNTAEKFSLGNLKIIKTDVLHFLKHHKETYDIIFADPPYDFINTAAIYNMVFANNLMKEKGWLIIEHSKDINFTDHDFFTEQRRYGKVNFSFFRT